MPWSDTVFLNQCGSSAAASHAWLRLHQLDRAQIRRIDEVDGRQDPRAAPDSTLRRDAASSRLRARPFAAVRRILRGPTCRRPQTRPPSRPRRCTIDMKRGRRSPPPASQRRQNVAPFAAVLRPFAAPFASDVPSTPNVATACAPGSHQHSNAAALAPRRASGPRAPPRQRRQESPPLAPRRAIKAKRRRPRAPPRQRRQESPLLAPGRAIDAKVRCRPLPFRPFACRSGRPSPFRPPSFRPSAAVPSAVVPAVRCRSLPFRPSAAVRRPSLPFRPPAAVRCRSGVRRRSLPLRPFAAAPAVPAVACYGQVELS
jgi:hypothetical protein